MKDEPRRYATAAAFRIALEARLKMTAQTEGIDLQRLRRQVSFDRLLARLFSEQNAPWLLKGGYAMELRIRTARTTKDIDLSLPVDATSERKGRVLEHLQTSAARDLTDFFVFSIGQPMMGLDAAPEGGARYPVTALLAGRVFTKFHLDVGMGDAAIRPTELLEGRNWLGFAGIEPPKFAAISKEQQFAEKLHAYTLPRLEGTNSRVKDVVDMALLLRLGTLDRERLSEAIRTTFALRNTHVLPVVLPEPPPSWNAPYQILAIECGLAWTLKEALQGIGSLLSDEIAG
jgi:predicted nucleotidyltransferase component of viral defense system